MFFSCVCPDQGTLYAPPGTLSLVSFLFWVLLYGLADVHNLYVCLGIILMFRCMLWRVPWGAELILVVLFVWLRRCVTVLSS